MKRLIFRSILFNICFYGLTALLCIACLPALVLPRRFFMGVVSTFVHLTAFLERAVLGLRYELRGAENIPQNGSYIIAAKHQSAYETTKLHILFKDPAVILKKELLSIPLWGWFLRKSDVIAIDRSSRESAVASINAGAERMKEQGRPIVIFPQGTRVGVDVGADVKPYKVGVARIQEATGLDILPVAMNAGVFWPRNGFFKSGGCVVFEFLPVIKPGMERNALMSKLENEIEDRSNALADEARIAAQIRKRNAGKFIALLICFVLIIAAYSAYWFSAAAFVKDTYIEQIQALQSAPEQPIETPIMSGFPFKITLSVAQDSIVSSEGVLSFESLNASSLPIPFTPVTISTGAIGFRESHWSEALSFDSLDARISYRKDFLSIHESLLKGDDFGGSVSGDIDFSQEPIPKLDIIVSLENHQTLLEKLVGLEIIEKRIGRFLGAGLEAMKDQDTGVLSLPIHQKGQTLMAGPLPVMKLPNLDRNPRRVRPLSPSASPSPSPAP